MSYFPPLIAKLILVPTKRTFQYVEQSVNHVIMLKTYVSAISSVYKALATAQSSLLLTIRDVSIHISLNMGTLTNIT